MSMESLFCQMSDSVHKTHALTGCALCLMFTMTPVCQFRPDSALSIGVLCSLPCII